MVAQLAEALPVAVVGMGFREGPTAVRAALSAMDARDDGPSSGLLATGAAHGVVRLETCSRVEWVLSAENPLWAAQLLRSGLLSRLGPSAAGRDLHVRIGAPALTYLVDVTAGLESLAEGEHAVGRQVLRAFETAHSAGTTDRVLHACWRTLGELLNDLRESMPERRARGVQSLVLGELLRQGVEKAAPIAVFGKGDIGQSVLRALDRAGYTAVSSYRRDTRAEFDEAAKTARAVVVCSGAPRAFLCLPPREGTPVALDLGSPAQLSDTPGWTALGLDELLGTEGLSLEDDARARLQSACDHAVKHLARVLVAPPPVQVLSAIDAERRSFLHDTLPALLKDVDPETAKKVVASVGEFTHVLLTRAREGLK